MNNLEQITKGFSFGYCAELKMAHVVAIGSFGIYLSNKSNTWFEGARTVEDLKITSWKYAGELAGGSVIPIGQKFRVKNGKYKGNIDSCYRSKIDSICLKDEINGLYWLDKSEIEPIFN